MACPSWGVISRRLLAQQQQARQMERRKRASYPCPARTRNTGAAKLAACWTGSPPQNNELRRKKTRSKSWGTGALTITTGMKDNIAYIQDRNAQLQELEKHKADLQKQLDELQDEGRRVGAPSSWFR